MSSSRSERASPGEAAARCQEEEASLAAATRRLAEENACLETRVSDIRSQNEALGALLREQEEYLTEVEAQIARMDERRRAWRRRYTELTGRAIEDPVSNQPRP